MGEPAENLFHPRRKRERGCVSPEKIIHKQLDKCSLTLVPAFSTTCGTVREGTDTRQLILRTPDGDLLTNVEMVQVQIPWVPSCLCLASARVIRDNVPF